MKNNKIEYGLWIKISFFLLLIGLLNFSIVISEKNLSNEHFTIWKPLVNELTGALTLIFIFPILISFFRKYPLGKNKLIKLLPIYFLVSLIFGFTHTTLMTISRKIIYPIIELGNYDAGDLIFRYSMEYQKQILTFIITYIIFYFIKSNNEREVQKLKQIELEQELAKAQLTTLRSQLNPHFLFNTLNMISSIMYEDPKKADYLITILSDLLRTTLNQNNKEKHSVSEELEIINKYLLIMKSRFTNKLSVDIRVDENTKRALVPWLILQPFLENSIKYGIENLENGIVLLKIYKEDERLIINIDDNGPGLNKDLKSLIGKGIGINNSLERLEKLYDNNFEFNIMNGEESGAKVTINLPFETNG